MNSPEWNSEEGIPKSKKEHEEEVGTMGQYLAMQWPLAVSFGLAAWFTLSGAEDLQEKDLEAAARGTAFAWVPHSLLIPAAHFNGCLPFNCFDFLLYYVPFFCAGGRVCWVFRQQVDLIIGHFFRSYGHQGIPGWVYYCSEVRKAPQHERRSFAQSYIGIAETEGRTWNNSPVILPLCFCTPW